MVSPFAAREARVNSAVTRHLANVDAVYTPVGGSAMAEPVPVVFDDNYLVVLNDGVASSGPVALVNNAIVAAPARGDGLVIRGTAYEVVEPRPDGTGMTLLRLRK